MGFLWFCLGYSVGFLCVFCVYFVSVLLAFCEHSVVFCVFSVCVR